MKKMCSGNNRPKLTFTSESYHYETRGSGKNRKTVKVTKFKDFYNFNFNSFKDISGLFKIEKNINKYYMKLELFLKVEFADDTSKYDYSQRREEIQKQDSLRDAHYSLTEAWSLDGFTQYNLINLGKGEPFLFNLLGFYIFTIFIPLFEFYKLYCGIFCIEMTYDLKKIVSTRNNLSEEENKKRYESEAPKLCMDGNVIDLEDAPPAFDNIYEPADEEELYRVRSFVGENQLGWNNYLKKQSKIEIENDNHNENDIENQNNKPNS